MYNPNAVVVVASPMEMFWYNQMMSGDMGIFGWVMFAGAFLVGYLILIDKYAPHWVRKHMLLVASIMSIASSLIIVKSGLLNWILIHLF